MFNSIRNDWAWEIANEAHRKQRYGNLPYLYHIKSVYNAVMDLNIHPALKEQCGIVTILHDVYEDNKNYSIDTLSEYYEDDILDALHAITKKDNEFYHKYIIRVSKNKLATLVKFCDLFENYRHSKAENKENLMTKYTEGILLLRMNTKLKKLTEEIFKKHIQNM